MIKLMQYSMQYYMFAQKELTDRVMTLNDYLHQQTDELDRLNAIKKKMQMKIRK